ELSTMLDMRHAAEGGWSPKVLKTEAQRSTGIEELTDEILAHRDFFLSSGTLTAFLHERNQRHFMSILRDSLLKKALSFMAKDNSLEKIVANMTDHHIDPYSAVEELVLKIMPDDSDYV
ncbi:MAG: methylmalonyl Co-A mutase-associated GTPase MeaB, partial [Desulfuromonadaceae bacterium]|nr:methylmalonyl Co-A mutase-associated GTPase MeaB [Desulfuromonadaceae bacterium]